MTKNSFLLYCGGEGTRTEEPTETLQLQDLIMCGKLKLDLKLQNATRRLLSGQFRLVLLFNCESLKTHDSKPSETTVNSVALDCPPVAKADGTKALLLFIILLNRSL